MSFAVIALLKIVNFALSSNIGLHTYDIFCECKLGQNRGEETDGPYDMGLIMVKANVCVCVCVCVSFGKYY